MAQLFGRTTNLVLKLVLIGLVVLVLAGALAWRLGLMTTQEMGEPVTQPVPFSHKHHVGDIGIDCRYCHTSVEKSAFAGMPPTHTCMTCHSRLFSGEAMLQAVARSFTQDMPLRWNRVNDLPDFAYFNHSIHVEKGVGCKTCHSRLDRMPMTSKETPMTMEWCLSCHRDPAPHLRPKDKVFDMDWQPPPDRRALGEKLIERYHINTKRLTDCSVCHR